MHHASQLPLPLPMPSQTEVVEVDSEHLAATLADVARRGLWVAVLECVPRHPASYRLTVCPWPRRNLKGSTP